MIKLFMLSPDLHLAQVAAFDDLITLVFDEIDLIFKANQINAIVSFTRRELLGLYDRAVVDGSSEFMEHY